MLPSAKDNRCRNNWAFPTGNQFNIISGTMYPTKEGIPPLLKRLSEIHYRRSTGHKPKPCLRRIPRAKYPIPLTAIKIALRFKPPSAATNSSNDQLRGKAERRAKKAPHNEYLTGTDYGDADETSSRPNMVVDTVAVEIKEQVNTGPSGIGFDDAETVMAEEVHAPAQAEPAPQTYAAPVQT